VSLQAALAAGLLAGAQAAPREGAWLTRHRALVEEARRGGVDVLFLGDSLTERWRTTGAAAWSSRLAPLKAANFGISGDRTQHLLWRLRNGELDGVKPRVVVVLIGINNIAQTKGPEPPASAVAGVQAVVAEVRSRLPASRVLLLGLLPAGDKPGHPLRAKVKEINDAIVRLDDGGRSVTYVDLAGAFLEPDGTLSREIAPDFLHLSARGYERWAVALREPLSRLLR
jgi:lysophospholipase L1-like esterase